MRWDPFRQVAPFLTGDEEPSRFMPDFQIEKTEDGFFFKADLAGIKENEVDIAVTGNRLTISGHIYNPRECSYAGFTRAFTLPEESDGNKQIRAALDGGVLTVGWSKGLDELRRKQRTCRATIRWRAGNRKAGRRETAGGAEAVGGRGRVMITLRRAAQRQPRPEPQAGRVAHVRPAGPEWIRSRMGSAPSRFSTRSGCRRGRPCRGARIAMARSSPTCERARSRTTIPAGARA